MKYCTSCGKSFEDKAAFCSACGAPLHISRHENVEAEYGGPAMLKLTNIQKDYRFGSGTVSALRGVSLEFRKSEFVCILGQSGSGKTTLLNIIGGLDRYTAGELIIQGRSTRDYKDGDWDDYRNHRIGFVFQTYNLIPHQTALANVELALSIAGMGRAERAARARKALERVGLGTELNKRQSQLSGGQMQRVAIARALVNEPDIILADEPTGALDSKTSVEILNILKEISKERLVVMVTHNGELAQRYASRIVHLEDGIVEWDSNPYTSDMVPAKEVNEENRQKKPKRAKMSFFTSLLLSLRNLLTKKGRTIITSFAGSIGVIGVCLVLALSSGFSSYVRRTEEEMLSYYPIQIREDTIDLTAVMSGVQSFSTMPDVSRLDDRVYVDDFLTSIAEGIAVKNNISEAYIAYLEEGKAAHPELFSAIQYKYGESFADNLFTTVETGMELPFRQNLSFSALVDYYTSSFVELLPAYENYLSYVDLFTDIVHVMPGTGTMSASDYADYVLSQYEIIDPETMHFPESENEMVLVVGENNEAADLILTQLGFLSEREFMELLRKDDGKSDKSILFEEILKKEYVLYYNDAVYTEKSSSQPFEYSGWRRDLNTTENGEEIGIPLKISAVLRLKEGRAYGCLTNGLNFTEATVQKYIAKNMQSRIVEWMLDAENGAAMELTPEILAYIPDAYKAFIPENGIVYRSPSAHLNKHYISVNLRGQTFFVTPAQDGVLRTLGGKNAPNSISIYPADFEAKSAVLDYLEAWNAMEGRAEKDKIVYQDNVGLFMGTLQTLFDAITYVLVALTSISLIVSTVMIGIITYVSVVERIKEIGILRSLGARKKDIRNLFNTETFIIGLAAGIIGIVIAYALSLILNIIVAHFVGITGIATLMPLSAIAMILASVVLSLISGLIPAQTAARKNPVIALRAE